MKAPASPISDDVFEVEGYPEMISDEAIGILADLFLAIADETEEPNTP